MKSSKEQLERLLKGYHYCVDHMELRRDDPANPFHHTFANRKQKKNNTIHNYDNYHKYAKCHNIPKIRKNRHLDEVSMYVVSFASSKTILDLDELSLFVSPRGVFARLFRKLSGIRKIDYSIMPCMDVDFIYHPQVERLESDLNRKIRDDPVWSDFGAGFESKMVKDVILDYDSMSHDEGLILGITTIKVWDVLQLPELSKLNKALNGLEKIVRDDLG